MHLDHGKTSLLDYIPNMKNVIERQSGEEFQHMGVAYVYTRPNDQKIAFFRCT